MGVEWAGRPADRLEGWRVGASVRSTRLILLSISNGFWLMERGGPASVGTGGGGEPTGRHAQQAWQYLTATSRWSGSSEEDRTTQVSRLGGHGGIATRPDQMASGIHRGAAQIKEKKTSWAGMDRSTRPDQMASGTRRGAAARATDENANRTKARATRDARTTKAGATRGHANMTTAGATRKPAKARATTEMTKNVKRPSHMRKAKTTKAGATRGHAKTTECRATRPRNPWKSNGDLNNCRQPLRMCSDNSGEVPRRESRSEINPVYFCGDEFYRSRMIKIAATAVALMRVL